MTQQPFVEDVELADWTVPPGREAEGDAFKRSLSRAASGLPTLLLFEGIDAIDAAAALSAVSAPAEAHVSLVLVSPPADRRYDPVGDAAAILARRWSERLYTLRIGESGKRVLPEWIGAIPGLGNLVAAVIMTVATIRRRGKRNDVHHPPDLRQILRTAERRPVALIARDLHRVDRASAESVCRLIQDAPVGSRLLVAGSLRSARQGDTPAPIRTTATGLPPERVIVHTIAAQTVDALDALSGLAAAATEIVETAAVIGNEFDGARVAVLAERDELEVEDLLALAARQGIVSALGLRELEDGDVATTYRFATPALRAAMLDRLPAGRRASLEARLNAG